MENKEKEIRVAFATKSPEALQSLCKGIYEKTNIEVIGVTTGAYIVDSQILETGNVTFPIELEGIDTAETFAFEGNAKSVGESIADLILDLKKSGKDLSKCWLMLLSDGTLTDGEELIKTISEKCPEIAISGGMASAKSPKEPTAVCLNGKLIREGAVGVLLCGEKLKLFQSYLFDWEEIGDYHLITRSEKNRVYEIDGIPATRFYGKFLGKQVEESLPDIGINYPLIFRKGDIKIGRACLRKFPDGSLSFAGHLKEGTKVKISTGILRGFSSRKKDLGELTSVTRNSERIFIFSCIARKNFLQKLAELELLLFITVPNIGFFTHGEFFKRHNEEGFLFNETLTVAGISTKPVKNRVIFVDENILYPYKQSETFKIFSPIFHLLEKLSREVETVETGLSHTNSCIVILEKEKSCEKWFCTFVSENAKEILGIDYVQIKSKKVNAEFVLNNIVHPEDKKIVREAIKKVKETGTAEVKFRLQVKDDGVEEKWIIAHVKCIRHKDFNILIHSFQDFTSDKQIEMLAKYDVLTKLFNRRILKELENELKSNNEWKAILFMDIDKFKIINDTYGHDKGDEVLKFVAKCIRDSIRKTDIAVRYAGDEFLVLLTELGDSKEEAFKRAKAVAERILTKTKSGKESIGIPIGLSIGIKVFKSFQDLNQIISAADKTMYSAKKKGGNRYEVTS